MTYFELYERCKAYQKEDEAFLFLITELSGWTKSQWLMHRHLTIDEVHLARLEEAIEKYAVENIPVQYLVGHTYFYGLKIFVNPSVLIPRFDTEEVVEAALEEIKKYHKPQVVDLCCGSGCIGLAIKSVVKDAEVCGIDLYSDALAVAKMNSDALNLDVKCIQNDLLAGFKLQIDVLVSNPPYIDPDEEVMDLVKNNEPHHALFSPNHGMYHYDQILKQSLSVLKDDGVIVFEIAYNKKEAMIALASKYYTNLEIRKDMNHNDRIMIIRGKR